MERPQFASDWKPHGNYLDFCYLDLCFFYHSDERIGVQCVLFLSFILVTRGYKNTMRVVSDLRGE